MLSKALKAWHSQGIRLYLHQKELRIKSDQFITNIQKTEIASYKSEITMRLELAKITSEQAFLQFVTSLNEEEVTATGLMQRFAAVVQQRQNTTAVVDNSGAWSFIQLKAYSDAVSHALIQQGISEGDIVAVIAGRSKLVVGTMLAIMQVGASYLPIDIDTPQDKFNYLLDNAKFHAIIYGSEAKCVIAGTDKLAIPLMESQFATTFTSKEPAVPYIIYTSGTTGNPKGVKVRHDGLVNLIDSIIQTHEINECSSMLQYASYAFDASIYEIFPILFAGGRLVIANESERYDLALLGDLVCREQITHACIPVAIMTLIDDLVKYRSLKVLCAAAEVCPEHVMQKWHSHGVRVMNSYGPTECSVCVTTHEYQEGDLNTNIGKPLKNFHIFISDESNNEVALGETGEIYIAGIGLADGYLNDVNRTNERFIYLKNGTRVYKTGDYGRYLTNGEIEFLGRRDQEVKIQGHRINLSQLESYILKHYEVKQCVVVPHGENIDKQLVVFYVANNPKILNSEGLKKFFPNYMLPAQWVQVEKIFLTKNGKIDTRRLLAALRTPNSYLPRKNEKVHATDELIAITQKTWCEILKLEQVESSKSFFELGGNSIKAIQLIAHLKKELNRPSLMITDLFEHPTLDSFTRELFSVSRSTALPTTPATPTDQPQQNNEIAIIAMSGVFPNAANEDLLWDALKNQHNLVPHEQLTDDMFRIHSTIPNLYGFDANFFEIWNDEALILNPQMRKFLECAWHALEKSGYIKQRSNLNIGVFAGAGINNYSTSKLDTSKNFSSSFSDTILNDSGFLATQISYRMNLTGPSMSINTACSTSSVAIIEGCKSLKMYEADLALVGGVSIANAEYEDYRYEEGMILSQTGECRPFDSHASGTIPGSAAGVLILKRLADAERDNDHILGVITGYGLNNDGKRKASYTAPSIAGQTECIAKAQQMSGRSLSDISYIECHGTGTKIGDPIEIKSLINLAPVSEYKSCALGSIKANIGHTDTASGVSSVIKICQMFSNDTIVAQTNFNQLNDAINLDNSPFYIPVHNQIWSQIGKKRIAAVSSFGIGGSNAHLIIEEYKNTKTVTTTFPALPIILPLSAKSTQSVKQLTNATIKLVEQKPNSVFNISYTLQQHREFYPERNALIYNSTNGELNKIQGHAQDRVIVMLFPGQGSQYFNMTHELYNKLPDFTTALDQCATFARNCGVELFEILFQDESLDISKTSHAQLAIFSVSYSLAKQLTVLGIYPNYYLGHSIGEWVAATLAEVVTLEDAIKIIDYRGKSMFSMPTSSMISVLSQRAQLDELLDDCEIAVSNGIENFVVSGSKSEIEELGIRLTAKGIQWTKLNVSHGFHSKFMHDATLLFHDFLQGITLNPPKQIFFSNVTGQPITTEQATSPTYWSQQIRSEVRFCAALEYLQQLNQDILYLEVGAQNILTSLAKRNSSTAQVAISTLPNKKYLAITGELNYFIGSLAALWCNGVDVKFEQLYGIQLKEYTTPTYCYDYKCYNRAESVTEYDLTSITPNENSLTILQKIFEELLGGQISITDNLFNYGLDSLMTLKATQLIERELQIKISPSDFMTYFTLDTLHQLILKKRIKDENNLHVLKTGSNDVILLIHPIGGEIMFYREFALCYNGNETIIALSYDAQRCKELDHITDLAQHYCELIKPFMFNLVAIGGSSFGGIIAYEMQINLVAQGIDAILFMLDSPGPKKMPTLDYNNPKEVLAYLCSSKVEAKDQFLDIVTKLRTMNYHEAFNFAIQYLDLSAETLEEILSIFMLNAKRMANYVASISKTSFEILYFVAAQVMDTLPENLVEGWDGVIDKAKLDVTIVNANHISINFKPHIEEITSKVINRIVTRKRQ